MITCPNCNHQNPDGALQCEACYTPLPALTTCPNCQAPVQADASFCGQCGNDLRQATEQPPSPPSSTSSASGPAANTSTDEGVGPESEPFNESSQSVDFEESFNFEPSEEVTEALAAPVVELETEPTVEVSAEPAAESSAESAVEPGSAPGSALEESATPRVAPSAPVPTVPATQIQTPGVALKHVQTQTIIAIPGQLSVVRIGKPNEHTPPDIDVSGLPDSEVVSRVHANLVIEGDVYYLEDMGSSNGTYINGLPLPTGNRHRLRIGDRIAFGKGDKVSFIFEAAR